MGGVEWGDSVRESEGGQRQRKWEKDRNRVRQRDERKVSLATSLEIGHISHLVNFPIDGNKP